MVFCLSCTGAKFKKLLNNNLLIDPPPPLHVTISSSFLTQYQAYCVNLLSNQNIILGITGSIAAYKSAELVRRLREQGTTVKVVMTTAATQFITPLTLQAVSGQRVHTELLDLETEAAMGHIELARWADLILIAPASADFLAKLAYGHADDLLSTLCLATAAPIAVAPAMNQQMWRALTTQENYNKLQQHGIHFLGPTQGVQACGEIGAGRMLEPIELVQQVEILLTPKKLNGTKVLVTAGPTREDIDPVRFISNRSSGRMGYAIAQAAHTLGAEVTLISGPVALSPPAQVTTVSVYSAQDMLDAVLQHVATTDIFIATAAVADYRPIQAQSQKIKKNQDTLELVLEKNPDIISHVTELSNPPFTVGFAAETNHVIEYAKDKLQRKKMDMIAANQVGIAGTGFDSEDNTLHVFWREGDMELPRCNKKLLAKQLMLLITERYFAKRI